MLEAKSTKEIQSIKEIYKDSRWVFVEKPAGLLMYWSQGVKDTKFLLQRVRDQVGAFVHPVQRLDRGTSGIVGFALSPADATALQQELQKDTSRKYYLALVRGRLEEPGRIDRALRNPKRGLQTALTLYRPLFSTEHCSLLQVEILTGRYHQIRKHLNGIGHPIIGDFEHGKSLTNNLYREKYGLSRPFLHAARLDLGVAPGTLTCPLPDDLLQPTFKIAEEFGILKMRLEPAQNPNLLSHFDDDQRKLL